MWKQDPDKARTEQQEKISLHHIPRFSGAWYHPSLLHAAWSVWRLRWQVEGGRDEDGLVNIGAAEAAPTERSQGKFPRGMEGRKKTWMKAVGGHRRRMGGRKGTREKGVSQWSNIPGYNRKALA